ncbi:MAG: late competence development ComFB family protein [Candidatus Ozemobacteraceae bacterium]
MQMNNQSALDKYDFTRLENMWMPLILDIIVEMVESRKCCDCAECVLDLAALGMNRLPPKYWVSGGYNAYTTPEMFFSNPENRQIAQQAVNQALAIIQKNPHH